MMKKLTDYNYNSKTGILQVPVDPQPKWDYSNAGQRHGRANWNQTIEKEIHFGKAPLSPKETVLLCEPWVDVGAEGGVGVLAQPVLASCPVAYDGKREMAAKEFFKDLQPPETMPERLGKKLEVQAVIGCEFIGDIWNFNYAVKEDNNY
jgi:hypothetical protein